MEKMLMSFFSNLFHKQKSKQDQKQQVLQPNIVALKEFCQLILMNNHEDVVKQCIETMQADITATPEILYILSSYNDVGYAKETLIKEKTYMVSSDVGAPDMETFFWFIDGLKRERNLRFEYDETKFSEDRAMDRWLGELAGQLSDLYILIFDGASDTYHFIVTDNETGTKAKILFEKMAQHDTSYRYTADFIDGNFCE